MAVFPTSSSGLELTMSVPGLSSSSDCLPSSGDGERSSVVRELDINQAPSSSSSRGAGRDDECSALLAIAAVEEEEEEAEDELEDSSNQESGPPARKKLRLTQEQSRLLEESFSRNPTLNPKQKEALAEQLMLRPRQVEVWFQNRRARRKLKQTEMECEYLKRWMGTLAEENRRLQREVEELRAFRAGPSATATASSLSMCPHCERLTGAGTAPVRDPSNENF